MHAFRGQIYESVLDVVGATPLVRLSKFARTYQCDALCLAKLEYLNPLGSVKDRIGVAMVKRAMAEHTITRKTCFVEATSGNTGIALAFTCAYYGIRLVLTMPESMSRERRNMLALFGAQLDLTPAEKGMKGALERARQLVDNDPHAIMLRQFDNDANPAIHYETTAEEIWLDTDHRVDYVVSGVGTGGTITGVGRKLKEYNPNIAMIAVEPENSPILSGGIAGPHKIQGIGAGFVPTILDRNIIDAVYTVSNETAFKTARQAALLEGLAVGISSGAALAVAMEIGTSTEARGKTIVTIMPSSAERYLSTELFSFIP